MPNEGLTTTVRAHRRARRLTQAELAQAVGVSRQTVISIEGGDYAPSVLLALRIAAVLKTPVDTLFAIAPDLSTTPDKETP